MASGGESPPNVNSVNGLALSAGVNGHETTAINSSSPGGQDFAASTLGMPSSILIITNIADVTFSSNDLKVEFEELFRRYERDVEIYYLRGFRRARIVFKSLEMSVKAHTELHNQLFNGQPIKCYYAQPVIETRDPSKKFLEPPPLDKQYLISPPASPPVGWEVINERQPAINYDLINAIASMGPGESYQVHSGSETQPSIVVHVCDDPVGFEKRPKKIVQTRRPDSSKPADDTSDTSTSH